MHPCIPIVPQPRGAKRNALTFYRLASLGARGNKASKTYAGWRERPTKKSAAHCGPALGSGRITAGMMHHRLHYGRAQGSASRPYQLIKGLSQPPRDHEETDRNGWMPSSLSKGLHGRRVNTSPNRLSARMRWLLASSRENISLAGNGASSSPVGSRSGRGPSVSDFAFALPVVEGLIRLVTAAGSGSA